jgi:hypothetical protein
VYYNQYHNTRPALDYKPVPVQHNNWLLQRVLAFEHIVFEERKWFGGNHCNRDTKRGDKW